MSDNEKKQWLYRAYGRTFWRTDTHRKYWAHFVSGEYITAGNKPWDEVELAFWARHPVIALRGVCATPRTVGELMALDGATLD